MYEDEFTVVSKWRRRHKSVILVRNTATNIRSVQQVKNVWVFANRLEVNLTPSVLKDSVKNLTNDVCSVMRLKTELNKYSSYLMSCHFRHKNTMMNPDK